MVLLKEVTGWSRLLRLRDFFYRTRTEHPKPATSSSARRVFAASALYMSTLWRQSALLGVMLSPAATHPPGGGGVSLAVAPPFTWLGRIEGRPAGRGERDKLCDTEGAREPQQPPWRRIWSRLRAAAHRHNGRSSPLAASCLETPLSPPPPPPPPPPPAAEEMVSAAPSISLRSALLAFTVCCLFGERHVKALQGKTRAPPSSLPSTPSMCSPNPWSPSWVAPPIRTSPLSRSDGAVGLGYGTKSV